MFVLTTEFRQIDFGQLKRDSFTSWTQRSYCFSFVIVLLALLDDVIHFASLQFYSLSHCIHHLIFYGVTLVIRFGKNFRIQLLQFGVNRFDFTQISFQGEQIIVRYVFNNTSRLS